MSSATLALDSGYAPLVLTGRSFWGSTGAAGVAVPAWNATAQKAVLYVPRSSNYNAVIQKVTIGHVSGTLEPGHFVYAMNEDLSMSAPSSTTEGETANALAGRGTGNNAKFYKAATVGASDLSYLAPIGFSQVPQTDSTANAPYTLIDFVNGSIVLQPGSALAICADAVSSAFVTASIGIFWYEDPI